jgi:hypothetical protein
MNFLKDLLSKEVFSINQLKLELHSQEHGLAIRKLKKYNLIDFKDPGNDFGSETKELNEILGKPEKDGYIESEIRESNKKYHRF